MNDFIIKSDKETISVKLEELSKYINSSKTELYIPISISNSVFKKCLRLLSNYNCINSYIVEYSERRERERKPNHYILVIISKDKKTVPYDILAIMKYALEQYDKPFCTMKCKFSKSAIRTLKNIPLKEGFTTANKTTQNEISGSIVIREIEGISASANISNTNVSNIVFTLDVGKQITIGENESVDVIPTRYNYHSHPKQAYVKNSVKNAWPSLADYFGYLSLGNRTIFHCVVCLEGIYIMSFGPYWVNRLNELDKKFITKNYDYDDIDNITPYQYVSKINKIVYKKHPIFNVTFLCWDMASSIFSVSYMKTGLNCNVD